MQLRAAFNSTAPWHDLIVMLREDDQHIATWARDEGVDALSLPYILSLHATLMLFGGNTNNVIPARRAHRFC
jgi:uncharacterized protein involved in copper resistance